MSEQMLTRKQKQLIRDTIRADKVTFKKDNTIEFKRSYFYRMGASAQSFSDRVVGQLKKVGFEIADVEARDAWAAWPKTSYFIASVRIIKMNEINKAMAKENVA